jgi:transposase
MELIQAQIKSERERDTADAQDPAVDRKRRLLCAVQGIGGTAAILSRDVFARSFASRRQLGSYLGLTPSAYDSSSTTRCLGISKAGNSWARRVLIEIAWFWRKYLPDSPLSRWYASKTADQSPRIRRIMLVALARKLAISLWRYVETGLVPEGVGAWPWPSRTRGNRRHVTRAEPSEPRAQSDPGRGDGWSRLRLASLAPAKV